MFWEVLIGLLLTGFWVVMASVSGVSLMHRMSVGLGSQCLFQQLHSVRQESMALDESGVVRVSPTAVSMQIGAGVPREFSDVSLAFSGANKVGFTAEGGTQFSGTIRVHSGGVVVPVSVPVAYGQVTVHAPE